MIIKSGIVTAGLVFVAATSAIAARAHASPVIEVVTAKLRSGVTAAQVEAVDHEIATRLISKRPGFLSRESAPGDDRGWLAIVHWRSAVDADASMKSFSSAPIAAKFLDLIEPGSMVMKRYGR
jgi:hypothetical protein